MMETIAFIFGMSGLMLGAIAYSRIDKLEKRLKELGVLEKDFTSDEQV